MGDITKIYQPETILGWYRKLIAEKYNWHKAEPKEKHGQQPIDPEWEEWILKLSRENREWGYGRIASYMTYLGMKISPSTVKRVLLDHGINPDPEQRKHVDWQEFIDAHKDIIAATDFMTAEIFENDSLTRYHILFFIKIGSREVKLGGIKHDPHGAWMTQIARNETDYVDGFLKNSKYLIMDNDPIYTEKVVDVFKAGNVTVKKTAVRAPQMNAYIERFIQTFQKECLNKLILTSEEQLRYVVKEFLEYYNHERPHQGLDGNMILPHEQPQHGEIIQFSRLGGLLKSYRRVPVTKKTPDFDDKLPKRLAKVG